MIVHDKYTSEVFAEFPNPRDQEDLLKRARDAGNELSALSEDEINAILNDLFSIMKKRRSETASTITAETGKPLSYSRSESERVEKISREIHMPTHVTGRCTLSSASPLGTGAIFTDFNEPFLTASLQAIPAVSQRNSVIILPYEETSASSHLLARMFEEAGFPAGSIQVSPDTGIAENGSVSFISSISGRKIETHRNVKRYFEEPGISVTLVWKDTDLDFAANVFSRIALENRFIRDQELVVAEDSFEYFINALKEEFMKKRMGNPADYGTDIGVVTFPSEAQKASEIISNALSRRNLLYGNEIKGNAVPPAIFMDDSIDIPNPVYAPVFKVAVAKSIEDSIRNINAAGPVQLNIFTSDLNAARMIYEKSSARSTYINDIGSYIHDINNYSFDRRCIFGC